ncbi:unnamed protein product (macronuclear) [Paramecium tetraurelia]|uniref:Uncharacterized protein n=1 Tax=Paramecium tetraurelia TaxID=5888 RepID=A0DPY6_PARTE|nr:uncharacterized protein GSPATT00002502001 [Paramecium tetraurelia]CAK85103.1 unnamed protein product [Paramecium tetraurelia]|eukprot:XP_001452500.1 hypothetical protein (macronuclear) [Paramecium tetraurelia strain d4-2]
MNLLNEKTLQAFISLKNQGQLNIDLRINTRPLTPTKKIIKLPKRLLKSITQVEGLKKQKSYHKQRTIIKQHSFKPEIEEVKIESINEMPMSKKKEIRVTDGTEELILRQQEIQRQTKKKNINEEINDLKKLEQQLLLTYTGRYQNCEEEEEQIETVLNERREQIYRKIYENVKAIQGIDQKTELQKKRDQDLLKYIKYQQDSNKNKKYIQEKLLEAQKQVEQLQKISRPGTSQRMSSTSSLNQYPNNNNNNEQFDIKINQLFIKNPSKQQQQQGSPLKGQLQQNSTRKLSQKISLVGSNHTSQQNIIENTSGQQLLLFNQTHKKIDEELLHILLTRWKNINSNKKRIKQKKVFMKLDDEQIQEKKKQRRQYLCQKLLSWLQKMNRCKISLQEMSNFQFPSQPFQIDGSFIFLRYIKYNNMVEIKNLIKFNRNLLFEFNHLGQTCLHIAASKGNSTLLQYLLQCGADYEAKDFMNRNPLWYAVEAQSEESFKMLLKIGATPWNIQTSNAWFADILQQAKKIHTLISISPHTVKSLILEHEFERIL